MIRRLIIALVFGIGTALLLLLIGPLVASIGSGPFDVVGHWLANFAWVIGFGVFLLAFFAGWSLPGLS